MSARQDQDGHPFEQAREGLVEVPFFAVAHEALELFLGAFGKVRPDAAREDALHILEHLRRGRQTQVSLSEIAQARASGRPLGHVLGEVKFLGDWYRTDPRLLSPHPATAVMVLALIARLRARNRVPRLGLEVGFATGVLSISLLKRFPDLSMLASDLSEVERDCALANARRLIPRSERFQPLLCQAPHDVMEPFLRAGLEGGVDVIVSNPPYLVREDEVSREYARYMSDAALYAPSHDPMHFYREIAQHASSLLSPTGLVCLEVRRDRATQAAALFDSQVFDVEILSKSQIAEKTDITLAGQQAQARQFDNHRFIFAERRQDGSGEPEQGNP